MKPVNIPANNRLIGEKTERPNRVNLAMNWQIRQIRLLLIVPVRRYIYCTRSKSLTVTGAPGW